MENTMKTLAMSLRERDSHHRVLTGESHAVTQVVIGWHWLP